MHRPPRVANVTLGGEACRLITELQLHMKFAGELPEEMAPLSWYAVKVRSKFERTASALLRSKGYEEFLPLVRARRRWSDRTTELDVPLFPGYVFCRFDPRHRVPVLETAGVCGIVGFGNQLSPVPEQEIRNIETLVNSGNPVELYPYLAAGKQIRIADGPFTDVEGIVVEWKNRFRLIVSVTLLQRSVAVEIDREWAAPIESGNPVYARLASANQPAVTTSCQQ